MAAAFSSLEGRVNAAIFRKLANADAVVAGGSFSVIFDNAYTGILGAIESSGPACTARTSDVPFVVQGTQITINAVEYAVTGVHPDGTGVTLLTLRG